MKLFLILFSFCLMASAAEQRHEHAHNHGQAKLALAFDGVNGKIDFEVPSESLYGFEYAPKTEADKTKQAEALRKLETQIGKMVVFPESSKCRISKEKIEVHQEGKHSDVDSTFNVICGSDLAGTTIIFNIQDVFPRVHEARIEVLIGDIQKSVQATKSGTALELKK